MDVKLIAADVYPSSYDEWQSIECVIGIINVYHAFIGEQQYQGRTHRQLAESGVFFYDYFYDLGPDHSIGTLRPLNLPTFTSDEWPLPSADISEMFRLKLFTEVQRCLKPNVAARQAKIKICMPINVFIDFFALGDSPIDLKLTMLKCTNIDSNTMLEFLDKDWDLKSSNGIQCKVDPTSVNVKYMIKSQNFIMSFYYQRSHLVNGIQVPLDQNLLNMQENPLLDIDIWMQDELQTTISIGSMCTLQQLREDLIQEDEVELPNDFVFMMNGHRVGTL